MFPRPLALLVPPVALALALSACGSALDPSEVGATAGAAGPGTAADAPGSADGTGSSGDGTVDAAGTEGTLPDGSDGGLGSGGDPGSGALPGAPVDPGAPPGPGTDSGGAAPDDDPTTGTSPGADPSEGPGPPDGTPAGACDGFTNTTGITDSTITIGNTADVSGAQPGLYQSAREAVLAYAAYFNSTSDICGRKLDVVQYDSKIDGGAEQQAYVAGCTEVFAMIGSMSAFDSAGAADDARCGLPDIRTASITPERIRCPVCFGALSSNPGEFQNAVPDFALRNYPEAAQHAAYFYINVGAAPDNAKAQVKIFTKRGMHFDIVQPIDISEFNYIVYAQKLKDEKIGYVQMIGGTPNFVRLAQAMKQIGYTPDIFLNDPTVYTPDYVEQGGSDVDGTTTFVSITPFEEVGSSRELQTYEAWLQQVHPGAAPSFFGVYAWSAAKLFVEQATALGGRLTRASLVGAVAKVDDWTAGGLHAPQRVGVKRVGPCNRFLELQDGRWRAVGGTKYLCSGTTRL